MVTFVLRFFNENKFKNNNCNHEILVLPSCRICTKSFEIRFLTISEIYELKVESNFFSPHVHGGISTSKFNEN